MWSDPNLLKILKGGSVAVMPTDTLYGIVGRAEDEETVNRIYTIRKRNPEKPCIILIGDMGELEKFSITLSEEEKNTLKKYWGPGSDPTSIILDCEAEKFAYLHRGTKTLAFRVPAQEDLQKLLKETGPLIAPSANLESFPPAKNITEAKEYFGNLVDLFIEGGTIEGKASKVIKLKKDGSVQVLRD